MAITYHSIDVAEGTNISYLTAGSPENPPILLLHGYPSSSNQYRQLAPLLASSFFVIAPDLPGFGLTTYPKDYVFTFENLTKSISLFLDALKIGSYAVYIFDYGAPVGLRLALQKPEATKAIITQNGNAYVEGFGKDFWAPIDALWKTNSTADRDNLRNNILTLGATKYQYVTGVPTGDLPLIDPVTYHYDYLQNVAGADNQSHQLDLFYDYRTNVAVYPQFHEYFRKSQVPLLAVWGKGDPAFIPPGAEAYKQDLPNATVRFVDAGHFALETKVVEISHQVLAFLKEIGYKG